MLWTKSSSHTGRQSRLLRRWTRGSAEAEPFPSSANRAVFSLAFLCSLLFASFPWVTLSSSDARSLSCGDSKDRMMSNMSGNSNSNGNRNINSSFSSNSNATSNSSGSCNLNGNSNSHSNGNGNSTSTSSSSSSSSSSRNDNSNMAMATATAMAVAIENKSKSKSKSKSKRKLLSPPLLSLPVSSSPLTHCLRSFPSIFVFPLPFYSLPLSSFPSLYTSTPFHFLL